MSALRKMAVIAMLAVLLLPGMAAAAGPDLNKLPIDQVCAKFYATPVLGTPAPDKVPPDLLAALVILCGPPP